VVPTLNQISRASTDKLDVAQILTEVFEKIAQLFEARRHSRLDRREQRPTALRPQGRVRLHRAQR
jgi:hypothetical protein